MVNEIHAGDAMSAVMTQWQGEDSTRKFFGWGGKNIIETVSFSANV
jgi:hypothetical protein